MAVDGHRTTYNTHAGPGPIMESAVPDGFVAHCQACGALADHYPFVKPRTPGIGLVCGRCGHVLHAPETDIPLFSRSF